jgi:hypothetical protein
MPAAKALEVARFGGSALAPGLRMVHVAPSSGSPAAGEPAGDVAMTDVVAQSLGRHVAGAAESSELTGDVVVDDGAEPGAWCGHDIGHEISHDPAGHGPQAFDLPGDEDPSDRGATPSNRRPQ